MSSRASKAIVAQCDEWLSMDLDDWARRMVRLHCDPGTGSPYWLKRAAGLAVDPHDIAGYDDLLAFGPMPLAELRTIDPVDLVPQGAPRPLNGRVWDTGGTTGPPCRVFYTARMIRHREIWRAWSFVTEGFREDRVWLQATPTGPHLIGNGVREVAEVFGGRVYAIDMDPRWAKRLLRLGRVAEAQEYTQHLLDQIADIVRDQPVDYLYTTPALLRSLARQQPDLVAGLAGVRLSGTHLSPAMRREFVAALHGGICGATYGNTFGNAAAMPVAADGELLPYLPNYPHVTMRVADPGDWRRTVPYGEVGQVVLTVLHEDLFLPNILERDQALRYRTEDRWPCDGVANVELLETMGPVPEGVY